MESTRSIVHALLVDPDETTSNLNRKRLEEEGYKVAVAADAAGASILAKATPPSVIFVHVGDQVQEAEQGQRIIERLRSDGTTRHVPVRLITRSYDTRGGKPLTSVARNAW